MNIKLLSLLGACLWVLGGCGGEKPKRVLHVVGHGPTGSVDDARAELRISFDRPVVEESALGRPLAEVPLVVSPKLPLAAHWLDRQTLVATPQTTLRKATRYTVTLRGARMPRRTLEPETFDGIRNSLAAALERMEGDAAHYGLG